MKFSQENKDLDFLCYDLWGTNFSPLNIIASYKIDCIYKNAMV